MTFDGAVEALNGAIAEDFGGSSDPVVPAAPVEQAQPATPEGAVPAPTVQPTQTRDEFGRFAPATPAETATDTFDGGQFNPDTLDPALQDGWKQLQAAYTRKTQDLATQRSQFETLGDFNEVRQATELFRALQDPGYLQEFHGELTRALEAQGLQPAHARAEAARQIEEQTAPTQSLSDALARLKDDPELAPVADTLTDLQSRLDRFEQQQQARAEAEQLAQQQMAMAGEIQRMEMAVRQSHPDYTQDDIDAVYELSAFFDGNLLEANNRYRAITNRAVESYLGSKQSPSPASAPVQGTGTSEIPVAPVTLDAAFRAALGHLTEQGIDTLG